MTGRRAADPAYERRGDAPARRVKGDVRVPPTRVSEKGETSGTAVMARSWWGTRGPALRELSGVMETLALGYGGGHVVSHAVKSHSTVLRERAGFTVNYTSTNLTFPRKEDKRKMTIRPALPGEKTEAQRVTCLRRARVRT